MYNKNTKRGSNIHAAKVVFYVCLTFSIALAIGGFLSPPIGVVDNSVITVIGFLLGFAALGIIGRALDLGKLAKVHKGDLEVTVGCNQENTSEEQM